MASLGELIIELGVVGDIKPLQDTLDKMKKAEKQTARLLKYLQDLKNAQTDAEKKLIKQNFARSISIKKTEEEIDGMKKLAGNIAGVVKGLTAFVTATAGVIYAIDRMTDALFQQNQAWINLTRQSDISLKTFQKYAGVASVLDRTLGMEGVAGSLADLEQRLFRLELLGEGAEGFLLAGINPMGKKPEQVIEDIRARIKGLSDKKATFLLKQMGIDPKLLPMLRMTKDEFEKLNAEIERYQLNISQREEIQKYQQEIAKTKMQLQYLKDRALLKIIPAFSKFMKFAEGLAEDFAKLVNWIHKADNAFTFIIRTVLQIAAAIGILKLALTALAAHPIIAAILAVVAIFETLYLIIDDIVGYFQGKRSVLGVMIQAFQDILGISNEIINSTESPQWLKDLVYVVQGINKLGNTHVTKENYENEMPKEPVTNAAADAMAQDAAQGAIGLNSIRDDENFWAILGMRIWAKLRGNTTNTTNNDTKNISVNANITSNAPSDEIATLIRQANYMYSI